jgi:dUTP pyrophosphatase
LPAGEVSKVPTGLAFEIPSGFYLQVVSRSGLSVKGIYNMVGVIDSDYRGEVHLLLLNTTKKPFQIEKGDRIAQALLVPIFRVDFKEVDELTQTKRGSGDLHSTGKK